MICPECGSQTNGTDYREALTPREKQVLELAIIPTPREEICQILGMKKKTLRMHMWSIYRKEDVRDLSQLIIKYHNKKILEQKKDEPIKEKKPYRLEIY